MHVRAVPLTQEDFRSFGTLIVPPAQPGERNIYTEWLGSTHALATPRLHVNYVSEVELPCPVTLLEKHPYSSQVFVPLEVSEYLIVVVPSHADGSPNLHRAQAFVAPGNTGVLYAANTWHAGAAALHRKAHFAVQMWRNDVDDDVFLRLNQPLMITL